MTDNNSNDKDFAKKVDDHIEQNIMERLKSDAAHDLPVTDVNGTVVGTVDHIDGDQLKLAKSGSMDGQHHFVPLSSIESMDEQGVYLNIASSDIK